MRLSASHRHNLVATALGTDFITSAFRVFGAMNADKKKDERHYGLSSWLVEVDSVSGSESLPVFGRSNESLNHLGVDKVAVEGIQLVKPEVESGRVGIASQVTEVFHQHESPGEFIVREFFRFSDLTQHCSAGLSG